MSNIQNNNSVNKNRFLSNEDIQKRKVIEHNDLISSVAKMDKTPLKIFELAVSCIDTDNPPQDNIVYLSKQELFAFFDVSDNDKHSRFKQAIEKMQKQAFFEIKQLKSNQKDYEMTSIVPIPTVKWNSYNDTVIIEFNRHIMPYLIELKSNFTQYAITDIMELNSKYSITLYKWLCMFYNQYEHYSMNGGRRNEQLESYKNPSIKIKDLRKMTDTLNEYKEMSNFTREVLNKAVDEINTYTHFKVTYEKIKKGRAIESIQFQIEKKNIARNENYKQEQQDIMYLQDQSKKEEQELILSAKSMQSPYTKILSEYFLIGVNDFMDTKLMAGLQQVVYPLYDELKNIKGINGVKEHLSYVANKQAAYSKVNIVKYLRTAIKNYLVTVKGQEV